MTVVGLAALAAFPFVYRALHALRHPIIITTVGGLILGILGFIGGPITMFKGLTQMGELLQDPSQYDAGQLAVIAGIKIVALLVAASALFRGGRIFPATFIGVALGLLVSALFPSLPMSLVVACAVLGIVLVVARDGWLAIFVAVAIPGDIALLPVLCIVVLPAWLLVSQAPEFRILPQTKPDPQARAEPRRSPQTAVATDQSSLSLPLPFSLLPLPLLLPGPELSFPSSAVVPVVLGDPRLDARASGGRLDASGVGAGAGCRSARTRRSLVWIAAARVSADRSVGERRRRAAAAGRRAAPARRPRRRRPPISAIDDDRRSACSAEVSRDSVVGAPRSPPGRRRQQRGRGDETLSRRFMGITSSSSSADGCRAALRAAADRAAGAVRRPVPFQT